MYTVSSKILIGCLLILLSSLLFTVIFPLKVAVIQVSLPTHSVLLLKIAV